MVCMLLPAGAVSVNVWCVHVLCEQLCYTSEHEFAYHVSLGATQVSMCDVYECI